MSTPQLSISGPGYAIPGREVEISVEVVVDAAIDVQAIAVRLYGVEGWTRPKAFRRERFVDQRVEVHHAGILTVGTHRFVARFELPADSPPTHDSGDSYASLRATATIVRGGLHFDVRASMSIAIRCLVPPLEPAPVERSNGAYDDHLAVSLTSNRLGRNETIAGTVVASRFDHDRPIELIFELVAVTERYGSMMMPARTVWASSKLVVLPDRAPVAFQIELVPRMVPSFKTATTTFRWELVVRALGRLIARPDAVVPIEIVDVDDEGALARATPVATDRIAAAFSRLAGKFDWHWHEAVESDAAFDTMHLAIERELGTAILQLAFSSGMPAGPSLIARIGYPSLELGLEVSPSTPFREWFSHDLTANDAEWDRRHRVTARDEVAAIALVRTVVPAILETPGLGALLRWNDHEIEFAHVTNDPSLEAVAADLERLATVIVAAVPAIPHDGVYR